MKVCFASDFLPGYHRIWGGAEQVCIRLLHILIEKGHEVEILCTKPTKPLEDTFNLIPLPVLEDYVPLRIGRDLRGAKTALFPYDPLSGFYSSRVFQKRRPDVLHLHNFSSLSFSLLLSAKRLNIPVVLSVYDYWFICPLGFLWFIDDYQSYKGTSCSQFHGSHCIGCLTKFRAFGRFQSSILAAFLPHRKKIFDFFLKKIDAFVVLSRSNSKVLENYGIPSSKIFVVPIPLSEEIDPVAKMEGDVSILYTGWFHPRKGLHVILKAMPQILEKRPDSKLYIIGESADSRYESMIMELIRTGRLEDNVVFLGKMPFNEVRGYLRKATVLVIPEQWETIAPNALTEGLVFGKAIVASNIGGTLDYIRDDENGLLASFADPVDYAKKILRVLQDRELRLRLGKKARETGRLFFSEERVYQDLLNVYESVM